MGNTPVYHFPYPENSDASNGPAQFRALAEAVEGVTKGLDDRLAVVEERMGLRTIGCGLGGGGGTVPPECLTAQTAVPLQLIAVEEGDGPEPRADTYPSNSALYADPNLVEGVDYGRRYRIPYFLDPSVVELGPEYRSCVLAIHGGGIEVGTSELCLAIAGFHPATGQPCEGVSPRYHYWMFEGLRTSNNRELHVTAKNNDDPMARQIAEGSMFAFALHGATAAQLELPAGNPEGIGVGGLHAEAVELAIEKLNAAGIQAKDARPLTDIGGINPDNIVNRTVFGRGLQYEISTELRAACFTRNTRACRGWTTTEKFWTIVDETRAVIAEIEATLGYPPIPTP